MRHMCLGGSHVIETHVWPTNSGTIGSYSLEVCDVTHSCVTPHLFVWLVYVWLSYVRHDSFVCDGTCRLFLSRGVWHNPSMSYSWFMCVIYSREWFIHVCDVFMCVVYSCVWFVHMWLKKSGIIWVFTLSRCVTWLKETDSCVWLVHVWL